VYFFLFFNVIHPLFKFIIFYGHRPTCDTSGFLREMLSKILEKNKNKNKIKLG
jgi:hypothetical protein